MVFGGEDPVLDSENLKPGTFDDDFSRSWTATSLSHVMAKSEVLKAEQHAPTMEYFVRDRKTVAERISLGAYQIDWIVRTRLCFACKSDPFSG